jgi:hypothetical protein
MSIGATLHPWTEDCIRRERKGHSVLRFPLPRMADMSLERFDLVKTSAIQLAKHEISFLVPHR